MIHTKITGINNHVIIMLHGTGGDELSLVDIARYLDPKATLIGVRGNIEENEMYRFFARYTDGSFDLKSLMKETKLLYEGINQALIQYQLTNHRITILGYSNGANIAINMLKVYSTNFSTALLFHPSSVRPEVGFKKQDNLNALVTYGANDPFTTESLFTELVQGLEQAQIKVEQFKHEQGHQLIEAELVKAKSLV